MIFESAKAAVLVFLAAIAQVSIFSSVVELGGTPGFLLVVLIVVALRRGALSGAVLGFLAGLVADTATLGTLGTTSLVLTLVGYWAGRYGETTGRDRRRAPLLAVLIATVLVAAGSLLLQVVLGEPASARVVLLDALPASLLWNLLLAAPLAWLVGKLVRSGERGERLQGMRVIG